MIEEETVTEEGIHSQYLPKIGRTFRKERINTAEARLTGKRSEIKQPK